MIDWIRQRFDALGHPLVARYPNLFLLRVHVMVPVILLASVVAAAAAAGGSSATFRALPDPSESMGFGLGGSLVVALVWGFLVTRDLQRFWPERGLKALGLLLVTAGIVVGIATPPIIYAKVEEAKIDALAKRPELRGLTALKATLRSATAEYLASVPGTLEGDAKETKVRSSTDAYQNEVRTFAAGICRETDSRDSCRDEVERNVNQLTARANGFYETLATYVALGLGCAGLALAFILAVRESSLRFALVTTGCFVGYFVLIGLSGSLVRSVDSGQAFGGIALLHWIALAVAASVQWARRSSGWGARVTAVLLAVMTPFAVVGYVLATDKWDHVDYIPVVVLTSYAVYFLLFPLIHGNLARLRFLPRP